MAMMKQNFPKSGVCDKVPEGTCPYFWRYPDYLLTQCRIGGRQLPPFMWFIYEIVILYTARGSKTIRRISMEAIVSGRQPSGGKGAPGRRRAGRIMVWTS